MPTTGMWKCDPIFADVNKDGFLDLAALSRKGPGPHVWKGNGKGEWSDSSSGLQDNNSSCGGGLAFGDVDNDGDVDLVVADQCKGVCVYLGDGGGRWEIATEALHPRELIGGRLETMFTGAEDVALADVNGDGSLDIVAASADEGGINLYHGDGSGRNWKRYAGDFPTQGWATRAEFFDLNKDGRPDIVAAYYAGPRVWVNDGKGGWKAASTGLPEPTVGGLYVGLGTGDINEDGLVDLALSNWVDGPEVYLQGADGSWHKTPDVFPEMLGGATGLALGDVDGDGHLDIVAAGRLSRDGGFSRGVFFLKGDGAGGWKFISNSGLPTTGLAAMSGVALADVNGDGVLDVAAASGLIVETVPGPREPSIPIRLPVWCGTIPPQSPPAAHDSP